MPVEKIEPGAPESQSADLRADNLARLKALFPELVTERHVDGRCRPSTWTCSRSGGRCHRDRRRREIRPELARQARARQLALTPSTGTLRPCPEDSVDWDTTQNLMIEGDNLEVLKLLQKSYAGKVKLIYIDPPYNTARTSSTPTTSRTASSNYLELTGQVGGGRKISLEHGSQGRFHTDWLNMMYPRLPWTWWPSSEVGHTDEARKGDTDYLRLAISIRYTKAHSVAAASA
jgi:adenine-specific DNA-methyltransferase